MTTRPLIFPCAATGGTDPELLLVRAQLAEGQLASALDALRLMLPDDRDYLDLVTAEAARDQHLLREARLASMLVEVGRLRDHADAACKAQRDANTLREWEAGRRRLEAKRAALLAQPGCVCAGLKMPERWVNGVPNNIGHHHTCPARAL